MAIRAHILERVLAAVVAAAIMGGVSVLFVPNDVWFSDRGVALLVVIIGIAASTPFLRGGAHIGTPFRWAAAVLAALFFGGGLFIGYVLAGNARVVTESLLLVGVFLLVGGFFSYIAWRGRGLF